MTTESVENPLQRDLADAIVMMAPLDEIRILLASGAQVTNSNTYIKLFIYPLHPYRSMHLLSKDFEPYIMPYGNSTLRLSDF